MEFDKSRVYTSFNADELRVGDKVIVGDTITFLKRNINNNKIYELIEVKNEDYSNRFIVDIGLGVGYALAYLVERKENCTNCALCERTNASDDDEEYECSPQGYIGDKERAKICRCDDWKSKTEQKAEMPELISLGNGQYVERKHYRPFQDTDELIKVWMDGGKYDHKEMPHIWIRQKDCSKGGLLITYFGEDEVRTDMGFLTMSKLLSDYTFTDGSVCGVEE